MSRSRAKGLNCVCQYVYRLLYHWRYAFPVHNHSSSSDYHFKQAAVFSIVFLVDTGSVYRVVGTALLYTIETNVSPQVSRRPVTAGARVRSHVRPCEICGAQSDTGTGLSPSTSVFPCQYHSTNAPYSSSSTCCSYQKDKQKKSGNLLKCSAFS